jgi:hypothetical protein
MATEPNVKATRFGPGLIYWAPLGTAEPTTPTATLDAAWVKVGFTENGSQLVINHTVTDLVPGEVIDPVHVVLTARTAMFEFAFAEMTAANLQRILNGGTIGASGPYTTYTPPSSTPVQTRAMLLWIADDTAEMFLMRQVVQVGNVTRQNRKGALSLYTAQFRIEVPTSGSAMFEYWEDSTIAA